MNERIAFFTGIFLHLLLIWTRINLFPFKDLGCINKDCTSIVVADIPLSIIYLAFSDPILIIFSLILGSMLWGIYFWLIYKLFYKIFRS